MGVSITFVGLTIFLVFAISCTFISAGELNCYICDSNATESACNDVFKGVKNFTGNDTCYLNPSVRLDKEDEKRTYKCMKTVTDRFDLSDGELTLFYHKTSRLCAYTAEADGCSFMNTGRIKSVACYCSGDYCNGASVLLPTSFALFVLVLVKTLLALA